MNTTSPSIKIILCSVFPRLTALLAALLLAAAPLFADTAEGPPEGALWTHLGIPLVFTPDREGVLHDAALSLGAEYGVLPWASLSAHWRPGAVLWADASEGPPGRVSDIA
ncbi:MAG: hypothetical protein LBP23_00460, partial [Treponema sp.]|nr:hypothetical protein [Treponema sp.]